MKAPWKDWWQDLKAYPALGNRLLGVPSEDGAADYSIAELKNLRGRFVSPLHPPRMKLVIDEIIVETVTTRTLRMVRTDGPIPPFRAGQYVNLFVEIDGVLTSRPYSISSRPGLPYIDLTVRRTATGFVSRYLVEKAEVGDLFESTGPRGSFRYEPLIDGEELVFIAGGSGMTPIMSMLRDAAAREWPYRVRLLYGNRSTEDIIFRKELNRLAHGHRNLHVDYVISEPPNGYGGKTGFMDRKLLQRSLRNPDERRYFICGPTRMYDLVHDSLLKLGVEEYRIRRELYGPPDEISADPAWPSGLQPDAKSRIEVVGKGVFEAPAGEPLLNSLERHGHVVPAMCRAGECSACRMRLLRGRVLIPQHTGIRDADRWNGYIHACTAYPVEDVVVKLP